VADRSAILYAIQWNRQKADHAERAAKRNKLTVPGKLARRYSVEEYRESLLRDADRHRQNIIDLEGQLSAA
jgi:hypothetical protein